MRELSFGASLFHACGELARAAAGCGPGGTPARNRTAAKSGDGAQGMDPAGAWILSQPRQDRDRGRMRQGLRKQAKRPGQAAAGAPLAPAATHGRSGRCDSGHSGS